MQTQANTQARQLQYVIAAVFLVLGAWCLVSPASVIALTVRPEHQSSDPLLLLTLAAFGSQAVLSGLFAGFSVFTRTTFLVYGIALLPFFVFNYWYYFVEPLFNELILLDTLGNIIMLAMCWRGYVLLSPRAG
jgi:hypothetical protein